MTGEARTFEIEAEFDEHVLYSRKALEAVSLFSPADVAQARP